MHLVDCSSKEGEDDLGIHLAILGHYSRLDHLLTWGDHLAQHRSSSHGPRPPHFPHQALSIEVRTVSFKDKLPVRPAVPIFSFCSAHITKGDLYVSKLSTRGLQES